MQCLQIKLIVRLNGHKTHVRAVYRLGDRFGIEEIVLVGLHKWLDELCRDQPCVVPLFA